ncbi:MAG: hypothetical protein NVSMB30_21500 [Hymenobacter sp.]
MNATFSNTSDRTLNINDPTAGGDLVIGAGSTLSLTNPNTTAAGLTLQLSPGATASIAGGLVFDASYPTDGTHRLLGSGPTSIEFLNGSAFTARPNYTGSPFGSASALNGAVVFRNGARYNQYGGSNPFSLAQPAAITVFEPNSYYYFAQTGNISPSLSGRTYGFLEYNVGNSTSTATGGTAVTFGGDVIVTSGNVAMNLTGGVNLKGNLLVNGGSLKFDPSAAATVQFNGATAQVIGGTAGAAALTFGPSSSVTINNPAGVTLQRPITLQNVFTLTNGNLTTDAANLLTLATSASIGGSSDNSFVNGPLARVIGVLFTNTDFLLPIGKGNAYRPFMIRLTQPVVSTYTVEQVEGNPGGAVAPYDPTYNSGTPLNHVSHVRSFKLSLSNPNIFTSGKITLAFGPDDKVNDPNDPGLVVASRSSSVLSNAWINLSNTAHTGSPSTPFGTFVSGTVTSKFFNVVTSTADFALGSTTNNTNFGIPVNPLPVELTRFTAERQGSGVSVRWNTASEKNSAYFEVQRSPTGREFATVLKVDAHGNSTAPSTYTALDERAPAGLLYYRLRQIDTDGKVAFSPVVTVTTAGAKAEVVLYPNPATSLVSFMATSPTTYRVLNQVGQVQMKGTAEAGTAVVEVGRLLPGVYLLELQTALGRVVRKFVRE